jgi:hypothetical protein
MSVCTLERGGKYPNKEACLDDPATQCEGPWTMYACDVDQTCVPQRSAKATYAALTDCRCQFIVVPLEWAHVTQIPTFANGTVTYYPPVDSAAEAAAKGGGGFNTFTNTPAKGQLFVKFDQTLTTTGDQKELWVDVPVPASVKRAAIAANARYVYIWIDQQNFMREGDVVMMGIYPVTTKYRLPFSTNSSNALFRYDDDIGQIGVSANSGEDAVTIQIRATASNGDSIGVTPENGKLIINMVAFSKFSDLTMDDLQAFYNPANPNAARFSAGQATLNTSTGDAQYRRPSERVRERMYVGSRGAIMFS